MTWVKICGITNLEDALVAVEAGADAVGFVFYEKSPRFMTPNVVREIVAKLPEKVETVGVFLNAAPEQVVEIADAAGISAVQLNGFRASSSWPVTKKKLFVAVPAGDLMASVGDMPANVAGVVVDSSCGTGQTFNWDDAWTSVQAVTQYFPVVVAGGLSPENVAEMMCVLDPWGVDVSSGVESAARKKDAGKVKAFVAAVRGAEAGR